MAQRHGYSLTELNDMLPWERDIYVSLLIDHVKKENERHKQDIDAINRK
jgi:hypothetical protein